MRAVVYDRYSGPDVLRLEDVERPAPKDDEVLIKIHATTVTRTDTGLRSAEFFVSRFLTGLRRPKSRILGVELAGVVEGAGSAVTDFEVGDEVFGACAKTNRVLGPIGHLAKVRLAALRSSRKVVFFQAQQGGHGGPASAARGRQGDAGH